MKQAVKGALLSGLVLPGLGQITLKRYPHGIGFLLVSLACIIYIVNTTVSQVMSSLAVLDPAMAPLMPPPAGTDHSGAVLWILGLCWVWSVLDAYRSGDVLDRAKTDRG